VIAGGCDWGRWRGTGNWLRERARNVRSSEWDRMHGRYMRSSGPVVRAENNQSGVLPISVMMGGAPGKVCTQKHAEQACFVS
jgi:hypothetical protein